jgi:hypothetical protein
MDDVQVLKDEEIKTTWTRAGDANGHALAADPDGTDPDGTDGDSSDATDGDTSDADGTDSDADGTDS